MAYAHVLVVHHCYIPNVNRPAPTLRTRVDGHIQSETGAGR